MKLIQPNAARAEAIRAYREEFVKVDSPMGGCGSLRQMEDPFEWLAQVEAFGREETVPAGCVLSTQFLYVREDGKICGTIQVRHRFNDFLEKYGGNIGYSVAPSERMKGVATAMLRDTLPYCRTLGLQKVLITCLDTNVGSRKTILNNGGVYESTVFEPRDQVRLERYWITL